MISATVNRTQLEATVSVNPRPEIVVGVAVPERPELNFSVTLERKEVLVEVKPDLNDQDLEDFAAFDFALYYQSLKLIS